MLKKAKTLARIVPAGALIGAALGQSPRVGTNVSRTPAIPATSFGAE